MNNFIFFILLFVVNICFSQTVEFGVGFSPYSVSESTSSINIPEEKYVEKILEYFYNNKIFTQEGNTTIIETLTSTDTMSNTQTTDDFYTIVDGSTTLKLPDIKKLFYGLGRVEIIRLLLIKQKCGDKTTLKNLVSLRKRNKTFKEIAKMFNIDYINDIMLTSDKIYQQIFVQNK